MTFLYRDTGQVLLEGAMHSHHPAVWRRATGTLLDRRPRYGCVKQGHSGDISGHGLSGQGLQSQRFPQASRQASASTDRTRGLLTGPKVWPARRDLDPRPRVCVQEAWGGGH